MTTRLQSRAAVFHGPRIPLELASFALPELRPGEMLVRIDCCTVCGSDLHTILGDRKCPTPSVLGHEMVGRISEMFDAGDEFRDVGGRPIEVGDRVSWSVAIGCGECFYCRRKMPQKCDQLFKFGHEATTRWALSGGLADFCHLPPGTSLVKVPDNLPNEVVCPANCATATVAAAYRVAGDDSRGTVVIHGAGMLGLTAAAMARQRNYRRILVTDVVDERLELARQFGATDTMNPKIGRDALRSTVRDNSEGRGADVVFEMSGAADAVEASIDLTRVGGRLILVGAVSPTRPAAISPEQLVRGLLRVEGVHNYIPADLEHAMRFLEQTQSDYPWETLVTGHYPLSAINDAIAEALRTAAIRVAITPRE